MKTTKDKVYSKLAAARTNLKSNKVALGLIDDFSYGDTQSLEEEVSRLSYSVEEWFDEKFDEWYEIGRDIYSVYFQNSEAFLTPADVAQDENVLSQIKEKAEELGLSAEDVYPEWQEHKDLLVYLEELQEKFESQKQRFSDESRSI